MSDGWWTDERIEALKSALSEGQTYAKIAAALDCSRNTVIGKAHRLGLQHGALRTKPPAEKKKRVRKPRPRKPLAQTTTAALRHPVVSLSFNRTPAAVLARRAAQVSAGPGASSQRYPCAASANTYPNDARMVEIWALSEGLCCWPIGEPGADDFRYCGADQDRGQPGAPKAAHPYCPFHMKLGTQEGTKLRVRRETSRARAVPTCEREPDLTEVLR